MRGRGALITFMAASAAATALAIGSLSAAALARGAGPGQGISRLIPALRHEVLPRHGGTVTSLNWSGYAVTRASHDITSVSSIFTVPGAGLVPPGFAATWTGIGGYNSSDLIQAGTAEQSMPSLPIVGPQYYAWYELLPGSEVQLTGCSGDANCTVTPGDQISVTISNVSGNAWSIAMNDSGRWSWSKLVTYASSRSSAEWILEAPTVFTQTLMAPLGTVYFGPTSSYTAGVNTYTIAQGNPTRIVLSAAGLLTEATPSGLASDGQSFNDCAYASSCPTP
jgi:hypothetical protein